MQCAIGFAAPPGLEDIDGSLRFNGGGLDETGNGKESNATGKLPKSCSPCIQNSDLGDPGELRSCLTILTSCFRMHGEQPFGNCPVVGLLLP